MLKNEKKIYCIEARFYSDDNIWIATSKDIEGLALECETLDELNREILEWAPELIEHNENKIHLFV